MYLNYIKIQNLKSLTDIEIKPKKITILIGPNSGGKSTILQSLALSKQSINESNGYFQPNGNIINLGKFVDLVSDHDQQKNISIFAGGRMFLDNDFQSTFDSLGLPSEFFYRYTVTLNGIASVFCRLIQGDLNVEFETKQGTLKPNRFTYGGGKGSFRLSNNNGMLPGVSVSESTDITDKARNDLNRLLVNADWIKSIFRNYFYIPSSRTMDEYGLPIVNVYDNELVTSKGQRENMSRLVSYLSSSPPSVINMISQWTEKLFGKKIKTRNVPTMREQTETMNVTIELLENQRYNSIINDGSGTNQVILLLTLLGITPPRSVLGIDEPEIHLHPSAQADLAKILIDVAIREEKQIIFTTHSEHMLYPFLTNIAGKKSLKREDVAIYYFEKDKATNNTVVTHLDIDDDGMISGGLKGFFEAELSSLNEYMKALGHD